MRHPMRAHRRHRPRETHRVRAHLRFHALRQHPATSCVPIAMRRPRAPAIPVTPATVATIHQAGRSIGRRQRHRRAATRRNTAHRRQTIIRVPIRRRRITSALRRCGEKLLAPTRSNTSNARRHKRSSGRLRHRNKFSSVRFRVRLRRSKCNSAICRPRSSSARHSQHLIHRRRTRRRMTTNSMAAVDPILLNLTQAPGPTGRLVFRTSRGMPPLQLN